MVFAEYKLKVYERSSVFAALKRLIVNKFWRALHLK